METIKNDPQGSGQPVRKGWKAKTGFLLRQLIVAIVKFSLITLILLLAVIGGCDVYESFFPEKVPPVYYIGISEERNMAPYINGSWYEFSDDPEKNWQKLQPTLKILRKVCPEAAAWVEDRHNQGKIVWCKEGHTHYGRYDYFDGTLCLCSTIISKRDGEKAVLLAHEFRHSRQGKSKIVKKLLVDLLTQKDNEDIIEKDAYDFEREVYIAIYGL